MILPNDYYSENKWCNRCRAYVRYMMSLEHSYCVQCGGQVTLFSQEDKEKFQKSLERKKFKAS